MTCLNGVISAVDEVTIARSEYSVEEGSGVVNITLNRTGDLLDDITIPVRTQARSLMQLMLPYVRI